MWMRKWMCACVCVHVPVSVTVPWAENAGINYYTEHLLQIFSVFGPHSLVFISLAKVSNDNGYTFEKLAQTIRWKTPKSLEAIVRAAGDNQTHWSLLLRSPPLLTTYWTIPPFSYSLATEMQLYQDCIKRTIRFMWVKSILFGKAKRENPMRQLT